MTYTALHSRFFNLKALRAMIVAAAVAFGALLPSAQQPKYIFYFIGDGMGINQVLNADIFNRKARGADSTLVMLRMPLRTMVTNHSANSDVTDSAAAGTALATGVKTLNGMLGMDADSVAVPSVATTLFDQGWGVGIVTSVGIDDATPGAFYAHRPSRHMKMEVARELAESGFQYAAGAGLAKARDKKGSRTDLLDYFERQGVTVVTGRDGLTAEADRLLLLSADTAMTWNIGYNIDSIPGALTLEEMTQAGLRQLCRLTPDRFFMMVEGGAIDHAGHANDGGTSVRETVEFDRAIGVAADFLRLHPDETLIVVTADHETGGMSIGTTTTGYSVRPWITNGQRISKERFTDHIKNLARSRRIYRWDDIEPFLEENLGFGTLVKVTDAQREELARMFDDMMAGRSTAPDQETLYATFDAFTARVFQILNDQAGLGFTSIKHTGAMVPLFAIGAGAQEFMSARDNTDIPRLILKVAR